MSSLDLFLSKLKYKIPVETDPKLPASFDLSKLKYEISVLTDSEFPKYFRDVAITVTYPGQAISVAQLTAVFIKRYAGDDGSFIIAMDSKSHELACLSLDVFDRFGQVRPWLIHNDYHRGSGVWGRELYIQGWQAEFLYVLDLQVRPEFRGQGVGSWTLQQLIKKEKEVPYLMCWPAPNAHPFSVSELNNVTANNVHFFRKNGFRRIGRTTFFGYATSETHPSRQLAASDDCDRDWTPPPSIEGQPVKRFRHPGRFEVEDTMTYSYINSRANLAEVDEANSSMLLFVRNEATNPAALHAQDGKGMTPLHVAAGMGALRAVQELLAADDPAMFADLRRRDNDEMMTPLEVCEMERTSFCENEESFRHLKGYEDNWLKVEWEIREKLDWEDGLGLVPLPAGTRLTCDDYVYLCGLS
ncbi:hypothetical protein DFH11DRAFT_1721634 [Phellopilus nigrolimitatus]|nr:hypothetical protein DFH11DRAFT_1721634 [Phellopilus nigrolimitatus]